MSKTIENIDISRLPEQGRQELYNFINDFNLNSFIINREE